MWLNILNIISFIGALGLIGAYLYLTKKKTLNRRQLLIFHIVNLFGGVSVGLITLIKGAYQSTILQGFWALIAGYGIWRLIMTRNKQVIFYLHDQRDIQTFFPVLSSVLKKEEVTINPLRWNGQWKEIDLTQPAIIHIPLDWSFGKLAKRIPILLANNFLLIGGDFTIQGCKKREIITSRMESTMLSEVQTLLKHVH